MKEKQIQRLAILLGVAVLFAAFKIFDLDRFFSLDYLKASRDSFSQIYSRHQFLAIAVYMMIYIVATAISLPGAAALTLIGGALFGFVYGTFIVSFASTIGATAACFVSRFILRQWVQQRFGDKLRAINRGIETEGPFYLFSLRLIPVFPFFVINLAMGITRMPLFSFYWVSQVGMLPGTMVYVNAGKELGRIDSLSGILSPGLIISFVILGLFPITVKKLMARYRIKKGKDPSLAE